MPQASPRYVILSALVLSSCARHHAAVVAPEDRDAIAAELARFQDWWLAPARIAPPTIPWETRTATSGSWTATATPFLAEDAAWNAWPEGARLFNNRVGYLFAVTIDGPGPLRWVPDGTTLRLNAAGAPLVALPSPEALLTPLVGAALQQEHWLVDGDLVERTRQAGAFRAAYLSAAPAHDHVEGVIVFPAVDADSQVISMALDLAIDNRGSRRVFHWDYE
jgi:hypothetical protein